MWSRRGEKKRRQGRKRVQEGGGRMRRSSLLVPVQRRGEQPHAEGASKAGHESAGIRGVAEAANFALPSSPSPSPDTEGYVIFARSHGRREWPFAAKRPGDPGRGAMQ